VLKRVVWSALVSLALLALLAWLMRSPWFYRGLGMADVATALERPGIALALFMLVLPVFTFMLAPLTSA
jgi:STE24 endopeptidase